MTIDPRQIGQRIQAARQAKLWTQLEFAREASVSPSTVARWESGKLPPVRELVRVAHVLGIAPEDLVEQPPATGSATTNERLDRLEVEVAESRRLLEDVAAALGVGADDRVRTEGGAQAV